MDLIKFFARVYGSKLNSLKIQLVDLMNPSSIHIRLVNFNEQTLMLNANCELLPRSISKRKVNISPNLVSVCSSVDYSY